MSHEIRTPMNGILGITEMLDATPLNAEQREFSDIIRSSAQSLLRIINDILDLSRIEAGRMTLESTDFDLRQVIEDVESLLKPVAHGKGIALVSRFPADTPLFFKGDCGRLRQILLNLAGNAIKFTESGSVTIYADCQAEEGGVSGVCIGVADTGIGIPADKRDEVFEKFSQADASTTRHYGGSGLGLAIAKSLTELMGGSIAVQSEPGKGSEFLVKLTLPVSKASAPPQPQPELILAPLSGHILIAEDNAVNQLVTQRLLRKLGCTADVAGNGGEALQMWQRTRYDLILMDCHMPGMDGYEATRKIRKIENGSRIPIVALTATSFVGAQAQCLEAGMDGFLAKPVFLNDLHAALGRHLPPASPYIPYPEPEKSPASN